TPRFQAKSKEPLQRHGDERRLNLDAVAEAAGLLGGDQLTATARKGFKAHVTWLSMLSHWPGEDLNRLLRRVGVAGDPGLTLPINIPDRVHFLVAVVFRHAPLAPAHHARPGLTSTSFWDAPQVLRTLCPIPHIAARRLQRVVIKRFVRA